MIQATIIVMTIMGCGDQGVSCDFIDEKNYTWNSKHECDQAIPETLLSVKDAHYPILTASCDARITKQQATTHVAVAAVPPVREPQNPDVKRPKVDVSAQANVQPAFYRLKDGYALVVDETSDMFVKLGKGATSTYDRLQGAVKLSLTQIADLTGRSMGKLRDRFVVSKQAE